ncbi:MAG TPA: glycosyltransferase [Gemmatimonadota bacterium]|nr:glycosyltransferase [Gemmatimonadota bacterium]
MKRAEPAAGSAARREAPADLSVVLVTDRYATIRDMVERLRAQTVRDRLELVLVASEPVTIAEAESDLEGFAAVQVVAVAPGTTLAAARAAGIRAATAPRVFIGETHCYPRPGMAEALIRAHEEGWDVVVPSFGNANPEGLTSWTGFIADYGPWVDGGLAGPIDYAPFYNVSYGRDVLLELGDGLAAALGHGDEMLVFLRSRGRRMYFEPGARIEHLNLARPALGLRERLLAGVLIGGTRSRRWGWPRRLLYAAASPLIAGVLAARAVRSWKSIRGRVELPLGTLPGLIVLAGVQAVGEAAGYARGAGAGAARTMEDYEIHKARYVESP